LYSALKAVPPMNVPSKPTLVRRIRELGRLGKQHGCDASAVVGTILSVWCQADYSALTMQALPSSKFLAVEPKLHAFVETLRSMSFLEATYWLSSVYAILAEDSYRKKLAMFFTPPSLTKGLLDDLSEQGVDFATQSFLDPACGGAAFLAPIALRIRDALLMRRFDPRRLLEHIENHVYGTDVDAVLCELSKQFLSMALHAEIEASGYSPQFKVQQADSLTSLTPLWATFDVVVCNPPYRKTSTEELQRLRATFGEIIEAQPNLYGLFIGLCVRLLRDGGHAALVTPTSFLSEQYFRKLRTFLMRNTDIAHIGRRCGSVSRLCYPAHKATVCKDVNHLSRTGRIRFRRRTFSRSVRAVGLSISDFAR